MEELHSIAMEMVSQHLSATDIRALILTCRVQSNRAELSRIMEKYREDKLRDAVLCDLLVLMSRVYYTKSQFYTHGLDHDIERNGDEGAKIARAGLIRLGVLNRHGSMRKEHKFAHLTKGHFSYFGIVRMLNSSHLTSAIPTMV